MQLTYLGTNALLFRKKGSSLLIDPHFTRPSLLSLFGKIQPDRQAIREALSIAEIKSLDGVLLTHTHYDHALDAVAVLHLAGGLLFGSESALNLARGSGMDEQQCVQVMPRQEYRVGAFRVSFHPSQHIPFPPPLGWLMPSSSEITKPLQPPAWFWRYQCGSTYAIQVDQILIFGSAGFAAGACQGLKVETVILGIGGLGLKSNSYLNQLYREAVLTPQAQQVFISHWDHFFCPLEGCLRSLLLARRTIERVMTLGARYGQAVHRLSFGQPMTIA
jgi:hypothetical protein